VGGLLFKTHVGGTIAIRVIRISLQLHGGRTGFLSEGHKLDSALIHDFPCHLKGHKSMKTNTVLSISFTPIRTCPLTYVLGFSIPAIFKQTASILGYLTQDLNPTTDYNYYGPYSVTASTDSYKAGAIVLLVVAVSCNSLG